MNFNICPDQTKHWTLDTLQIVSEKPIPSETTDRCSDRHHSPEEEKPSAARSDQSLNIRHHYRSFLRSPFPPKQLIDALIDTIHQKKKKHLPRSDQALNIRHTTDRFWEPIPSETTDRCSDRHHSPEEEKHLPRSDQALNIRHHYRSFLRSPFPPKQLIDALIDTIHLKKKNNLPRSDQALNIRHYRSFLRSPFPPKQLIDALIDTIHLKKKNICPDQTKHWTLDTTTDRFLRRPFPPKQLIDALIDTIHQKKKTSAPIRPSTEH